MRRGGAAVRRGEGGRDLVCFGKTMVVRVTGRRSLCRNPSGAIGTADSRTMAEMHLQLNLDGFRVKKGGKSSPPFRLGHNTREARLWASHVVEIRGQERRAAVE
jgi:hypothetical protein